MPEPGLRPILAVGVGLNEGVDINIGPPEWNSRVAEVARGNAGRV